MEPGGSILHSKGLSNNPHSEPNEPNSVLPSTSRPWVPVTTARHVTSGCGWGVDLQIWRLTTNILNKRSWTLDQERSSSLGVGREADNLTEMCSVTSQRASELN